MDGDSHTAEANRAAEASRYEQQLGVAIASAAEKQARCEQLVEQITADEAFADRIAYALQPGLAEFHRDFQRQAAALQSSRRTVDQLSLQVQTLTSLVQTAVPKAPLALRIAVPLAPAAPPILKYLLLVFFNLSRPVLILFSSIFQDLRS